MRVRAVLLVLSCVVLSGCPKSGGKGTGFVAERVAVARRVVERLVQDALALGHDRRDERLPGHERVHDALQRLLMRLNTARKNNRLYVRLLAADAGAVVSGEPLSALPPSVLGVLEADRSAGDFVPLRNATLGEWDLPTEYAVVGARTLTINLDAN